MHRYISSSERANMRDSALLSIAEAQPILWHMRDLAEMQSMLLYVHREGRIIPCTPPRLYYSLYYSLLQSSVMFILRHSSRMASGQMLDCISPMCAFLR